ncbi:MAG TPA: glycosyltransferase family 2 protein [Cytophagaceae bacterium]|nr:glycosyltransferase family 2 protein [Cytophagaceae bacterium]
MNPDESDKTRLSGGKKTKGNPSSRPLVSIITIVFNNVSGIEKTIRSIFGQNLKNFEYIIIDGGSTDGTLDIIRKYEDGIAYWISEADKGIYDAMNKGMKQSTGMYLWFINSGDLIESSSVLENIPWAENADVYYGETHLIDDSGKVLGTRTELTTRKLPAKMIWKDMIHGMVVSHQSVIVKKEIAPSYDTVYKYSSDIDWVITCLKAARKIVNADAVLSKYLIGGFSIKNQKRALMERFVIYIKHYGIFDTLLAHISIAFNALKHALSGRRNY